MGNPEKKYSVNVTHDSHAGMSLPLYGQMCMTKFVVGKATVFKKSHIFEEKHASMFFLARPQAPSIIQQSTIYENNLARTSLKKVNDKVFFIFSKNGIFSTKMKIFGQSFFEVKSVPIYILFGVQSLPLYWKKSTTKFFSEKSTFFEKV